jgi:hypothetical protein
MVVLPASLNNTTNREVTSEGSRARLPERRCRPIVPFNAHGSCYYTVLRNCNPTLSIRLAASGKRKHNETTSDVRSRIFSKQSPTLPNSQHEQHSSLSSSSFRYSEPISSSSSDTWAGRMSSIRLYHMSVAQGEMQPSHHWLCRVQESQHSVCILTEAFPKESEDTATHRGGATVGTGPKSS